MTDPITVAKEHFDSTPRERVRGRTARQPRRVNLPVWGFSLLMAGAVIVGIHVGLIGLVILALILA